MSKVIGIDLGTTNSVVSTMEGNEPKVIVNEEGDRVTPSIVAWSGDGEILVGQIAKRQSVTNPTGTVYSAKRFIGHRFEEVSVEAARVPFKVIELPNGDAGFEVGGKTISPPEVAANVLRKLKKAAENYLGEEVKEAVITVPAYFNDSQRQATKDAGRIAGLDVKRIINEPTAAALAYGLDKKEEETIVVYDFGGGTFDVSVLEVGDGIVQVVSTHGDTHLGGDDIDRVLIEHLIAEFKKDTGVDVSSDKMVVQRLKDAAEKAKIELSSKLETEVNLPFLTADASGPKHLQVRVSRAALESLIEEFVERTFVSLKQALEDAGKATSDIDEVILVGGSTRIPLVQQRVETFFGKAPHRGVNPDEVVALGAAVQGGVLAGEVENVVLLDVTPLSLGVETLGGVMTPLLRRNTTIPAHAEETFSTADDNQTRVDIHVLQGERAEAKDNRTLGRFHLEGIQPAPRGAPKVKVSFDIDANGILSVTARDEATGKDQKITITANSGLSENEIQAMVEDAEKHADDDTRRRAEVQERNGADQLCYRAEHLLSEGGADISAETRARIESQVSDLRRAIEERDAPKIRAGATALSEALREIEQASPPQPESAADRSDDVVDAEFEDVAE